MSFPQQKQQSNKRILSETEISDILQSCFGLTAEIQIIHPKGEKRTQYLLENVPLNRRMTVAGLERLCRRIAKALDAELYGTVNIDFASLGDFQTFDLLLEAHGLSR